MSGVPRSLNPLRHEETQIGDRARSASEVKLVSMAQAMYEVIMGAPPPGAQQQLFMAHDHCYRGISLPRQTQYCFDCGANISAGNSWRWQAGDSVNWYTPLDGSQTMTYETATSKRSTHSPAMFRVYVTPGIDSDHTAVSTNPCYLRFLFLVSSVTYASDVRAYNRTRDAVSATVNVGALGANLDELSLSIPCVGGVVNEIDIEILSTTGNVFILHQGFIAETRSVSQPQTAGTQAYASATRP